MAYLLGASLAGVVVLLALRDSLTGRAQQRGMVTTGVVVLIAGLGAKGYSLIERGGVLQSFHWELSAGYRYPGAMMAVLFSLPIVWRILRPGISIARFLDAGVLGVCAGMVVVRIGCFMSGCCHGVVSNVPWATRYGTETSPWHAHRTAGVISPAADWSAYGHPLQLYFLVAIAATGTLLLWFRKHHQTVDGQLTLIFMVLNGISKGALESIRFSYMPSLQVYSFMMATIGLVGLGIVHTMKARSRSPGDT